MGGPTGGRRAGRLEYHIFPCHKEHGGKDYQALTAKCGPTQDERLSRFGIACPFVFSLLLLLSRNHLHSRQTWQSLPKRKRKRDFNVFVEEADADEIDDKVCLYECVQLTPTPNRTSLPKTSVGEIRSRRLNSTQGCRYSFVQSFPVPNFPKPRRLQISALTLQCFSGISELTLQCFNGTHWCALSIITWSLFCQWRFLHFLRAKDATG